MKDVLNSFSVLAIMLIWVAGAVVANGFWSTLAAVFLPPWAFYLIIERIMEILHII